MACTRQWANDTFNVVLLLLYLATLRKALRKAFLKIYDTLHKALRKALCKCKVGRDLTALHLTEHLRVEEVVVVV